MYFTVLKSEKGKIINVSIKDNPLDFLKEEEKRHPYDVYLTYLFEVKNESLLNKFKESFKQKQLKNHWFNISEKEINDFFESIKKDRPIKVNVIPIEIELFLSDYINYGVRMNTNTLLNVARMKLNKLEDKLKTTHYLTKWIKAYCLDNNLSYFNISSNGSRSYLINKK